MQLIVKSDWKPMQFIVSVNMPFNNKPVLTRVFLTTWSLANERGNSRPHSICRVQLRSTSNGCTLKRTSNEAYNNLMNRLGLGRLKKVKVLRFYIATAMASTLQVRSFTTPHSQRKCQTIPHLQCQIEKWQVSNCRTNKYLVENKDVSNQEPSV